MIPGEIHLDWLVQYFKVAAAVGVDLLQSSGAPAETIAEFPASFPNPRFARLYSNGSLVIEWRGRATALITPLGEWKLPDHYREEPLENRITTALVERFGLQKVPVGYKTAPFPRETKGQQWFAVGKNTEGSSMPMPVEGLTDISRVDTPEFRSYEALWRKIQEGMDLEAGR